MDWLGEGCSVPETLPDGSTIEVTTIKGFECIVISILRLIVPLAGLAAFIMLVIGGFKYLTASGDPKKAEAAQKTITYAILGLALLLAGWFIMRFIENLTGVTVTQFEIIPSP